MVDFICIDRVKIFLSNIAKLKMLRYKHVISIFSSCHKKSTEAYLTPRTRVHLYKTKQPLLSGP